MRQNQSEKRLVIFSLVGIIFSALGLFQEKFFPQKRTMQASRLGTVEMTLLDARIKSVGDLGWTQAHPGGDVYPGDEIFTGEHSKAKVNLEKHAVLELNEQSLVYFRDTKADLKDGHFQIKVDGNVKVLIKGRPVELKGHHASVKIVVDKKEEKASFVLTEGTAQVQTEKSEVKLEQNQTVAFKAEQEPVIEQPVPLVEETRTVASEPEVAKIRYYVVDDFYDTTDDTKWRKRTSTPGLESQYAIKPPLIEYDERMSFLNIKGEDGRKFVIEKRKDKVTRVYLQPGSQMLLDLSPGHYSFRARAINEAGEVSDLSDALEVVIPEARLADFKPQQHSGIRIFGGLGANYFQINENISSANAQYHDITMPSLHFGLQMDLTEKTAVEAEYKDTPIRFNNVSAGVGSTSSDWQTFGLQISTAWEGASRFFTEWLGGPSEFRLLYGMKANQMPLSLFDSSNNPVVRSVDIIEASFGGRIHYNFNDNTRAEIFTRIEYPLFAVPTSAGASFSSTPLLIFDGSIGVDKRAYDDLWLGLHWFGQYQSFNFSYSDASVQASGSHSALFSAMEIRLMLDF